jgi:wyosine [tRNA(Phe)-imidazoG37] synthetase (radical SAM superfamily)
MIKKKSDTEAVMKQKYLFGPVPSRRLGISLGIDLIPHKTCSLNCVYCECGRTTNLTIERKEYVPTDQVINELDQYLKDQPQLDYITFAGSGEPLLHSRIGQIIDCLKTAHPGYKLCLLTNGTLFTDQNTRKEVLDLDLIIPSLDAATEESFVKVNRPHKSLECNQMIEDLVKLREEFPGTIILEIMIVPGLNDSQQELVALKSAIKRIRPDRVQLGTLDRPGTESWVEAAPLETMEAIARFLGNVELIGNFKPRRQIASFNEMHSDSILEILKRRPCTVEDLQQSLNLHPAELQKYVNQLLEENLIKVEQRERGQFLILVDQL